MSCITPLRRLIFSTTTPEYASSTSTSTSSNGSSRSPVSGFLRVSTRGRPMVSSKPSRRICSISTPSCNSPRPATSNASDSLLSVILMATLPSLSRSRRSRIWRDVTFLPSLPPSGPSLTRNVIASVGGSTGMACSGAASAGSPTVSGTVASVSPATATMSPASHSSTGTRSRPR